MKLKHTILAVLLGCFTFSFVSCSKVNNAIPPSPTASRFLQGADGPPLWIVDNVDKGHLDGNTRGKLKINPNQIASVTVLSPASTDNLVSRFGEKGKNGVVLVTTKK